MSWNKGIPHTEEHNKKISLSSIGKKLSDETKLKISTIKRNSEEVKEHCRKIAKTFYVNRHSPETNLKKSIAMKKWHKEHGSYLRTDEWRAKFKLIPIKHHIDGNNKNNDPTNIFITTRGQHVWRVHQLTAKMINQLTTMGVFRFNRDLSQYEVINK